jgi:hypothetical protein
MCLMQDTDFVISPHIRIAQGVKVSPETMLNTQSDQGSLSYGYGLQIAARSVSCLDRARWI